MIDEAEDNIQESVDKDRDVWVSILGSVDTK